MKIMINISVPENYRYVILRYNYLFKRRTDAITFLLEKHFNDKNTDYLNSMQLSKIVDEACDALIEETTVLNGIIALLTNKDTVVGQTDIQICDDDATQLKVIKDIPKKDFEKYLNAKILQKEF